MSKVPKLAIFDFDGTIATKKIIASSVIEGIKHLQSLGCITTLSTGRGYARLKEVLGSSFNDVISSDAIIMLEHGSKLVNTQGEIVFGEFISSIEIDHILDFARANIELFKFLWINHEDGKRVSIWCVDESDIDEQIKKQGSYADVFTAPFGGLRERLSGEQFSSLSFKLREHIKVENLKLQLTRTETTIIFQDGNMDFMRNNINKGLSALKAIEMLGLTREDTLIAGNAINDVAMLDLGAGSSILIGPHEYREGILPYISEQEAIVDIDSPHDLGAYLKSL